MFLKCRSLTVRIVWCGSVYNFFSESFEFKTKFRLYRKFEHVRVISIKTGFRQKSIRITASTNYYLKNIVAKRSIRFSFRHLRLITRIILLHLLLLTMIHSLSFYRITAAGYCSKFRSSLKIFQ